MLTLKRGKVTGLLRLLLEKQTTSGQGYRTWDK